jgi:hypothetical protein
MCRSASNHEPVFRQPDWVMLYKNSTLYEIYTKGRNTMSFISLTASCSIHVLPNEFVLCNSVDSNKQRLPTKRHDCGLY